MPRKPAIRRPIIFNVHGDALLAVPRDKRDARLDEAVTHVRQCHAHAVAPQLNRSFVRAVARGFLERAARPQDDGVLLALLRYAERTATPVVPSVSRIANGRRYRIELRFVVEKPPRGVDDVLLPTRSALIALMKPHVGARGRIVRRWQTIQGTGCRHQFAELVFTELSERAKDHLLDLLADPERTARAPAHASETMQRTILQGLAMLRLLDE